MTGDREARDYTEYFLRHLIGLTWYDGPVNAQGEFTRQPEFHCASGFLLQVHNTFCLVTAGHVLTDHEERKKQGIVGKHHSLFDGWSPKAKIKEPTPFDFTQAPILVEYAKDRGLDFAVISLPNFILEALLQTIEPFAREQWLLQAGIDFDFYAVLGIPAADATQDTGSDGRRHWVTTFPQPRVIIVEKCPSPPSETQGLEFEQFVGSISPNESISEIGGTSGGPVLGFRKGPQGELLYWPVAIQSGWWRRSRVMVGTLLPPVAEGVHAEISGLAGGGRRGQFGSTGLLTHERNINTAHNRSARVPRAGEPCAGDLGDE